MSGPDFDVTPLVPEARPIAREAAAVYVEHTRPWFLGLVALGSAVKGDFIPGCSDMDFMLFLDDSAFREGCLPLQISVSIHRDLSRIDPRPFAYIQCYALPPRMPDGQYGPIPSSYHVLAGQLPVPEATTEDVRRDARTTLNGFRAGAPYGLLFQGPGLLERDLRLMWSWVRKVVFSVLAFERDDVLRVSALPTSEAIGLLGDPQLRREVMAFHQTVRRYYTADRSVDLALEAIGQGVACLASAKRWWNGRQQGGPC